MLGRVRNSVHVNNLPDTVTYNDVWLEFKKFGEITNITIPVDVNTAQSKGYAFVEYPFRSVAIILSLSKSSLSSYDHLSNLFELF
ncbi:uncharacterized protein DEA37_0006831 [Paragonimus westermani]|uniref:RRM domain-containing protein n=1 Tax=Paragonimus westermani TaxID=34504 RepID=A0A5J4NNK7_9TREM|nr:uncharacterized protein DEA37_0006831 [Paragonimus westermani]